MNENEKVFCLKLADLQTLFGGPLPQGGASDPDFDRVFALPQYFIRRAEAEHDPGYKQLIPYQLFIRQGCFFVYRRGGGVGEQRLCGRLSVGIGGHINDEDAATNQLDKSDYKAALLRERNEELICGNDITTRFSGWINDDSDAVGRVHLGAVHCCAVKDEYDLKIREHGEDIQAAGWWPAEKIMAERQKFEKWSILAVELVRQASFPDADREHGRNADDCH